MFKLEQISKSFLSSDCGLKLAHMKLESLVIVDQHATVNLFLGLVHTACHALRFDPAKSSFDNNTISVGIIIINNYIHFIY